MLFQVTVEWTAATSPPLDEVVDCLIDELHDHSAAVGLTGSNGEWDAILTVQANDSTSAENEARRVVETAVAAAGQTGVQLRVVEVLDETIAYSD